MASNDIQRTLLRAFVTSLIASALVAIWILISGEANATSSSVLGTTGFLALFSLLGMAANSRQPDTVSRALAKAGVASGLLGFTTSVILIWGDLFGHPNLWRVLVFALVTSFAVAHASLLQRLTGKTPQTDLVISTTLSLNGVITVWLWLLIASDGLADSMGDSGWRMLGVLAVLAVLGTLIAPIMPRITQAQSPDSDTNTSDD